MLADTGRGPPIPSHTFLPSATFRHPQLRPSLCCRAHPPATQASAPELSSSKQQQWWLQHQAAARTSGMAAELRSSPDGGEGRVGGKRHCKEGVNALTPRRTESPAGPACDARVRCPVRSSKCGRMPAPPPAGPPATHTVRNLRTFPARLFWLDYEGRAVGCGQAGRQAMRLEGLERRACCASGLAVHRGRSPEALRFPPCPPRPQVPYGEVLPEASLNQGEGGMFLRCCAVHAVRRWLQRGGTA